MKKLLFGLTLLASMSSFASDCSITARVLVPSGHEITADMLSILEEKGYNIVHNSAASKFLNVATDCKQSITNCFDSRCHDREVSCGHYVVTSKIVSGRMDPSLTDGKKGVSNPIFFMKASLKKAVKRSLEQLESCE